MDGFGWCTVWGQTRSEQVGRLVVMMQVRMQVMIHVERLEVKMTGPL